jgi:hypothetical protein
MATKVKKGVNFFGAVKEVKQEAFDAHYSSLPANVLHELVVVAVDAGGAVLFGATRDGGAASVRLYLGGEGETFYFKPGEDIEDFARHWIEQYRGVIEERESPKNGKTGG